MNKLQNEITPDQFYTICDRAHALFGSVVILIAGLFLRPHRVMLVLVIGIVIALWKEFIYDMNKKDESLIVSGGFWGGVRDFLGYLTGAGLALIVYWVKWRLF